MFIYFDYKHYIISLKLRGITFRSISCNKFMVNFDKKRIHQLCHHCHVMKWRWKIKQMPYIVCYKVNLLLHWLEWVGLGTPLWVKKCMICFTTNVKNLASSRMWNQKTSMMSKKNFYNICLIESYTRMKMLMNTLMKSKKCTISKKTFVVVDDVDTTMNLRDLQLLNDKHVVNVHYKSKLVNCWNWQILKNNVKESAKVDMTFLDGEQTRELFMFHAFKHANPVTNDFKNIFMEIIKTCGGLQELQTSIGQLNALQNLDLKHRSSLQ